ncbi:hypothetical protein N7475_007215 [Penicillium sp. IBT 31633x]|nr:hypothetical protein N7475_007215 [Penicillium sp. IBT 31633x]
MFLLASTRVSFPQAIRPSFRLPASKFHTSAARTLNENDRHREDLPNHYESHKQDVLKETKDGKGKWKSELASTSEQNMTDRGEYDGEHPSFEAMQQETKHLSYETHKRSGNKQ